MDITLGQSSYGIGIFDSSITFPDVSVTKERVVNCYEIEFFDENGGVTYINGIPHQLRRGSILCARPNDIRYTELPLKAYYVKVDPSCAALVAYLKDIPHFFAVSDISPFVMIIKEMLTHEESNPLHRHSLMLGLIARLCDESVKWKRLEQIPMKKSRESIDLGIEYMEKHFAEKCTLEDIAAYAHFSPIYFHGIFKIATGKTPYEYLMMLRIDEARRLLLTGNTPMATIAEQSGFTSQSYFNYVFKRETGQTPSAYRKRVLERYLKEDGRFALNVTPENGV